ncbi:MAG TPA: hypothetical protein VKR82_05635 [Candidatus Acidoferrales bacterium]|nr:hypothetical protein [Candidatus Acidoferrales bacterium]
MKKQATTSTLKKVVVVLSDRTPLRGYLNPSKLGRSDSFDLLTEDGEQRDVPLKNVRSVFFVREFTANFEPERKAFLSRPKLDGLWVLLKFQDNETLEGVVPNDLLALLDAGVHIMPPDLHGDTVRIFIPRAALLEMKVLGVVGIARRKPAPVAAQPGLFTDG